MTIFYKLCPFALDIYDIYIIISWYIIYILMTERWCEVCEDTVRTGTTLLSVRPQH